LVVRRDGAHGDSVDRVDAHHLLDESRKIFGLVAGDLPVVGQGGVDWSASDGTLEQGKAEGLGDQVDCVLADGLEHKRVHLICSSSADDSERAERTDCGGRS